MSNKYNNIDLSSLGLYLIDHNAFAMPKIEKGIIDYELRGGGQRIYTQPSSKDIKLTMKLDNLSAPDTNIINAIKLFAQSSAKPFILEERPDRYINCLLKGSVSIVDEPEMTEISLDLVAENPFFLSLNEYEVINPISISMGGNAPHFPKLTVTGIALNPTISIVNSWGTFTKTYTGSLGASDKIVIDTYLNHCTFNTGNVDGKMSGGPLKCAPGANTFLLSSGSLKVEYCYWYY